MSENEVHSTILESRRGERPPGSAPAASSQNPASFPDDRTFLTLAQSTARIGLWSWDLTSDTIWRSDGLLRLHGVGPGGLGERLEDYLAFVHPDDRQHIMDNAAAAATGDTVPVEYRFIHPEAGVRHFIGHSALVRDAAGNAERLVGTVQDITEVRRARRSVSDAFARVSAFFEETPTPAYLWRKKGDDFVLQRFNRAARARWGDRTGELAGMAASEVCADRPDIVADIRECLRTQTAITRETDFDSATLGSRRLVITYVPVAPDAVVAHAEDVSDLVAVSLREERAIARLAEYFQRVPTPAYLWRVNDGKMVLEAANRAGIKATDGKIVGLLGVDADGMYADRPDIVDDLRRAFSGETFTRATRYQSRSTGEAQDVVATYVHIPPDTVVAHVRDVTEQRRIEEELRESHEAAHGIMEGNPDGICLIVAGCISACNDSLSALMGCSKEKLIGRRLHDLMVPEDRERAQERGRMILEGEGSEPSEYTLRRCDGSLLPVEIYSAAFPFRREPALVCTLRDIARRKGAERELAESRDALRALTQHLEEVRELERAQVARDLHDELGSVLTALKIDLDELVAGEPAEGATELLDTMSGLVDQAIEVGRRVTSRLRPGILDDLGLAAAAEWLGSDLEKRTGVRCRVVLPEVEPELAEPVATTMFRILQEALTNVLRHAEADSVEIALEADEESVSLTIADTGRGFDPSSAPGCGFGLLGMRERVRAFDGTFDIASAPGRGTKIRVALPKSGEVH